MQSTEVLEFEEYEEIFSQIEENQENYEKALSTLETVSLLVIFGIGIIIGILIFNSLSRKWFA